jgi:hypothetical protein
MLFIAHLCNHILRQSGGGTWGTALYTVRGVGSGSRDVDAWTQTSLYAEDRKACFGLSDWTTLTVFKWLLKHNQYLKARTRIVVTITIIT